MDIEGNEILDFIFMLQDSEHELYKCARFIAPKVNCRKSSFFAKKDNTQKQNLRKKQMSSTGTGSVGSKDDQNLVKKNDAVNAVEDDEKITDLIDADDGDTDGGDDQHGHHPNLV